MPNYFNIFECGGNLLDRLGVTYERVCMDTPKEKYYTKLLKSLVDNNNRNGAPLSNEKIRQAVSIVMEETEAELKRNINEITMDTSFQSPVQNKDVSTINSSGYYESYDQVYKISDYEEQVDASIRSSTDSAKQVNPKSDPISDPRIATHITNGIQKLLINQIPISVELFVIGQDLVTSVLETSR